MTFLLCISTLIYFEAFDPPGDAHLPHLCLYLGCCLISLPMLRQRTTNQRRTWVSRAQHSFTSWRKRLTNGRDSDMATLKRSNSKSQKDVPQRSCIICTENEKDVHLIRACRICYADYCVGCLRDMFIIATTDITRMPPQCCVLIQIHTVLAHLTEDGELIVEPLLPLLCIAKQRCETLSRGRQYYSSGFA